MKHKALVIIAIPALVLATACGGKKKKDGGAALELKSQKDSASYAIGLDQGARLEAMLQQGGGDSLINREMLVEGFNDYMKKAQRLKPELAQKALMNYTNAIREKQVAEFKAQNGPKMEEAQKWMEENGKKAGIVTTESGLQYEILKKGSGKNAAVGNTVKVHYEGAFTNGEPFESSYEAGQPIEFELNPMGGIIQGWVEAIQLMNKGARFKVYIPYDLAYGEMGKAPKIPPFTNLVFTMELVDIQ